MLLVIGKDLKILDKILEMKDMRIKGIEETKKTLKNKEYKQKYLLDVQKIQVIDDITILKKYDTEFLKRVNATKDILNRVKADSINDVVSLGMALESLGLNGSEVICQKWELDLALQRGIGNRGKNPPRKLFYILILIACCIISLIIGFLLGEWYIESENTYDYYGIEEVLPRNERMIIKKKGMVRREKVNSSRVKG